MELIFRVSGLFIFLKPGILVAGQNLMPVQVFFSIFSMPNTPYFALYLAFHMLLDVPFPSLYIKIV